MDEAYRFLQNKWLEKQMQVKRKQTDDPQIGESENDSQTFGGSGSGLLKKKRSERTKVVKSKK